MSNGPRQIQSGANTSQSTSRVRAPGFLSDSLQNANTAANNALRGLEDPVTSQGRDLVGQTLRGDFLSPDSNPFLQQTFDRGANAIQRRLDSQFAGAGRNIGASRAPATQELSDLATGVFGGNLQNERDRQTQALFSANQFNPIDTFIRRLSQIAPASGRDVATIGSGSSSGRVEDKSSPFDRFLSVLDIF
jgi:hypothetical protein